MRARRAMTSLTAAMLATAIAWPGGAARAEEKEDVVKVGDWVQIILPAGAFATTLVLKDWQGSKQFLIGGGVALATTHVLKFTVGKLRPDDSAYNSWPSGHTAAAFFGAAFVHHRYGWKYGFPMYVAAAFVGYTRVLADRHWTDDVFAGATLSIVSSWIFTTPYADRVSVTPHARGGDRGLAVSVRF